MLAIKNQLPSNYEIELRVLSGLAYLGNIYDLRIQRAMLNLDEDCFLSLELRKLYKIISKLFNKQQDISLASLFGYLPDDLYKYANEFLRLEFYTGNYLESDVNQLITYKTLRNQLRILQDAISESTEALTPEDSLNAIATSLQRISEVSNQGKKSCAVTYEQVADELLQDEENGDDSQFLVDIEGLPPVPNKSLITIAGRSGHGKTFFTLYLMDAIINAKPGYQTLYFNLEMHERVMLERHALLIGTEGNSRIERIKNALPQLLSKNVYLINKSRISIEEIETEARLAAMRQPIAVIVVDYLGLVTSKAKFDKKQLEQYEIARRLAALARDLNCIVIDPIQVNRDFKSRPIGQRCPFPEDSSESMGSVDSATWWLGIDRPSRDSEEPQWKDLFMVQCRKSRVDEGEGLFSLLLKFKDGRFSKWEKPFSSAYSLKPSSQIGF